MLSVAQSTGSLSPPLRAPRGPRSRLGRPARAESTPAQSRKSPDGCERDGAPAGFAGEDTRGRKAADNGPISPGGRQGGRKPPLAFLSPFQELAGLRCPRPFRRRPAPMAERSADGGASSLGCWRGIVRFPLDFAREVDDWESPERAGRSDDETLFEAFLSCGFWMQETMVTQFQYMAIVGMNPSRSKGPDDAPVENVSWNAAQEFIRRLNTLTVVGRFRLPHEIEWEYAARAGNEGPFGLPTPDYRIENCESEVPSLNSFAWYNKNSVDSAHPVAQKRPNPWGLCDMHGNVREWCEDWKGNYPAGSVTDWIGPDTGSLKVFRGGSWYSMATRVRAASRDAGPPDIPILGVGFRCVRDTW